VVRTRVGYAGDTDKKDPTYYDLGNNTETIQIDYDPTKISYEKLLAVFWDSHNATARQWSQQYKSIVFFHNEKQKNLAIEMKSRLEAEQGNTINTEIVPYTEFHIAEAYHQKYLLRQNWEFAEGYKSVYPDTEDFVNSTAVARVNGYLGGYGTVRALQDEIDQLGLSASAMKRLMDIVTKLER
jgi:peptide-methionine (S)-S-oxide reductase